MSSRTGSADLLTGIECENGHWNRVGEANAYAAAEDTSMDIEGGTRNDLRILVLGDSGVGKTSLVRALCSQNNCCSTTPTVGCYADVACVSEGGRERYIEYWDVGGQRSYDAPSRSIFYTCIDAVMFVFDATKQKSYRNLRKWMEEILAEGMRRRDS